MKFYQLWLLWTLGTSVLVLWLWNKIGAYDIYFGASDVETFGLRFLIFIGLFLVVFALTTYLYFRGFQNKIFYNPQLTKIHYYLTLLAFGILYYSINQQMFSVENSIYFDWESPAYNIYWNTFLSIGVGLFLFAQAIFIYNLKNGKRVADEFLFKHDHILDA